MSNPSLKPFAMSVTLRMYLAWNIRRHVVHPPEYNHNDPARDANMNLHQPSKRNFKGFFTIFLLTGSFYIVWTPYAISSVTPLHPTFLRILDRFCLCMASVQPMISLVTNSETRKLCSTSLHQCLNKLTCKTNSRGWSRLMLLARLGFQVTRHLDPAHFIENIIWFHRIIVWSWSPWSPGTVPMLPRNVERTCHCQETYPVRCSFSKDSFKGAMEGSKGALLWTMKLSNYENTEINKGGLNLSCGLNHTVTKMVQINVCKDSF